MNHQHNQTSTFEGYNIIQYNTTTYLYSYQRWHENCQKWKLEYLYKYSNRQFIKYPDIKNAENFSQDKGPWHLYFRIPQELVGKHNKSECLDIILVLSAHLDSTAASAKPSHHFKCYYLATLFFLLYTIPRGMFKEIII